MSGEGGCLESSPRSTVGVHFSKHLSEVQAFSNHTIDLQKLKVSGQEGVGGEKKDSLQSNPRVKLGA